MSMISGAPPSTVHGVRIGLLLGIVIPQATSGQMPLPLSTWEFRDSLSRPKPRHDHAMAPEDHLGTVLLFGGGPYPKDETWRWDGMTWARLTPAVHPPERAYAAMAYDSDRRRVVLFGGVPTYSGISYDDTWEWDGTTWQRMLPSHRPPGSAHHAMIYDQVRRRVVLYGGGSLPVPLSETWLWDGSDWIQAAVGSLPGRGDHAMAFDGNRGTILLFGGLPRSGLLLGDTWEWDGTSWSLLSPPVSPRPRVGHAMTYHAGRGRIVLFGGFIGLVPPWPWANDTWEWDAVGRTWVPVSPSTLPENKAYARAAYDVRRSRIVMFGGQAAYSSDATWTYLDVPLIASPTQPAPGQSVALWVDSPRDPGSYYLLACSFSRGPGIPVLPDGRVVSLGVDELFLWSLGSLAPPFLGFAGSLDGFGRARATIQVPADPALAGLRFFVSGITLDLASVRTILNEVELTLRNP